MEEAVEIALIELDASRNEVEIDVISQGKAGILGIGSELAAVNVTKIDNVDDSIKIGYEIVSQLIELMGVDLDLNIIHKSDEGETESLLEIVGDDSGLLIGRKGETLKALQFLTNVLVSNKTGVKSRVSIDVEGYEDRRNQSLINLANRVAQRVTKTGRDIELEPMNPRERRVIHMALADHSSVATESSGSGFDRRVVISPI
ncbi:MAG: protein jag [SAR202 cluster bacterium]|nr:protein jag [SAR202 cluster bacterium]